MKKAFIIIPTYNEKDNITPTVDALLDVFKTIKDWQMSILVVDDTSPDKTYEVVQNLQKEHKNLHLVINKKKSGLGGAYLRGMKHAFGELNADLIFEFDADLSHDPLKVPAFLKEIDKGADFVLGSRYIKGGSIPKDWGFHRKLMSIGGNAFIRMVLGRFSIKDWTTGYRAITKPVYEAVHSELGDERFSGYTFQIGFLYNAVKNGFKIVEIPFHFKDRVIGQSKIGAEYIKNTILYVFKVRSEEIVQNRIFKFLVVGTIGATTQLISLYMWRLVVPYQLAVFLSIEMAVVANFILSNTWTFSDRKLTLGQVPLKFITFNLASGGSIVIQMIIATLGAKFIGLHNMFTIPVIHFGIDTGLLFAVVGILTGMFWNFFAYSKIVWKKK